MYPQQQVLWKSCGLYFFLANTSCPTYKKAFQRNIGCWCIRRSIYFLDKKKFSTYYYSLPSLKYNNIPVSNCIGYCSINMPIPNYIPANQASSEHCFTVLYTIILLIQYYIWVYQALSDHSFLVGIEATPRWH